LFFLAGDDVAAQAIGNIEACHRLLAGARGVIHPFSLKIVVGRDVVENIYPMGRIPDWIAVRSAPSRPLPECRGLPISSQLFRTHPELPLLPRQALDYIREHGLYQAAPSPESQLHLQSTVILSFLPPGLHQLVAEELTNTEELPPLLPHGRGLTTGILGEKRVTLLAAAGKETSLLPVMERSEVRTVLGIGLCGSFQAWLQPGTIVLPSAAIRGEGITCYWADPRFSPTPDFGLLRALVNGAEALGLHPRVGPLYTTASLAHERQIAATFSPLGVLGVEMELAVHWTLAALHGKRAASIYVASDNIVLGDDILRTGIAETPLLQRAVKAAVATLTQMMVTHAEG
jgi:purine-nucleoside phosphorylase